MSAPTQLGKYQLIRRIAVGGMAEVFLGRAAGPAGFSKVVAIKRIHAHLVMDSREFVEMFLDEARLAAQLDHPNIVQIIDLGQSGEDYFLAMEFVRGRTLRQLINKAVSFGQLLPLDAIFTVARGVLSALQFAHSRRGSGGQPAPVVHRDVSPQNILVSYDGNVKLADFGIAKAQDRVHVTQAGVIKGKAYYMPPEQMYDGKIDARADIYAFGAVLHELLTGRKLFGQYSQSQLFNPELKKSVPAPSQVVPGRPAELDAIVKRMLNPKPEHRFQSCSQVIASLEEVMLTRRVMASPDRLSQTMHKLFKPEMEEDQAQLDKISATPPPPPTPDMTGPLPREDEPTPVLEGPAPRSPASTGPLPSSVNDPSMPTMLKELAQDGTAMTSAVTNPAIRIHDSATATAPRQRSDGPSETSIQPVALTSTPEPRRTRHVALLVMGAGMTLLAAAIVFRAASGGGDAPLPPRNAAAGAPVADAQRVRLRRPDGAPAASANDGGQRVRLKARQGSAASAPRVAAKKHKGPRPRRRRRGNRRHRPARAKRFGRLTVHSTPAANVYLGKRRLGKSPIDGVRVPAGRHRLRLRNRALRVDYRTTVTVAAGEAAVKRIRLGKGTVRINAIPWAKVFVDGRKVGVTPMRPLKLYAGTHVVELVYPAQGGVKRHRRRIAVRSGGNHPVIHNFLRK